MPTTKRVPTVMEDRRRRHAASPKTRQMNISMNEGFRELIDALTMVMRQGITAVMREAVGHEAARQTKKAIEAGLITRGEIEKVLSKHRGSTTLDGQFRAHAEVVRLIATTSARNKAFLTEACGPDPECPNQE